MPVNIARWIAFVVILAYLFARVYLPWLDSKISPFIAIPGLVAIWGVVGYVLTPKEKPPKD